VKKSNPKESQPPKDYAALLEALKGATEKAGSSVLPDLSTLTSMLPDLEGLPISEILELIGKFFPMILALL